MEPVDVEALQAALDVVRSRAAAPSTDSALVALNDALCGLRRQLDAAHAAVAAQIARASRVELGNAGLARTQGFRSPVALIAAATGGTTGDAARLVAVGQATAPRMTLTGDAAPAKHPAVADAVRKGRLSVSAAGAIVATLDRVAITAGRDQVSRAEETLVAQAVGLSLSDVAKLLQRALAWLDPDGVAPREEALRGGRELRVRQQRDGSVQLTAVLDPESAAPVTTVLEAMVGVALRARQDHPESRDTRSVPQVQADALVALCRHAMSCDDADLPTDGATVVVRVALEHLESGRGHATIDGITAPVSVGTARRMAAAGRVIPCVLGGTSEILDFGRSRRLFSRAQKLALVERDGGCAMCGAPPGMTQVHHWRWWARDAGPTDLANGVLLCIRCHHRIHDDGWDIRIDGPGVDAKVWFIPPPHVDPSRTPRMGGRARYDFAV